MRILTILLVFASVSVFGCNDNADKKTANSDENTATEVVSKTVSGGEKSIGKPINLTKADFLTKVMNYEVNQKEWIYEGDKPALIDFYADWCGPCRQAAPVLEELAKEYKDQIYIYKIDTQVERELASVFGISSIPAFLFVPMEGKPTMSNGIARTPEETKKMFESMIQELLLESTTTSQAL